MSSDTSNDQSTLDDLIQKASNFLQKGNTEQAEAIYLQILSLEPGHADSLHMVGLLRFQSGHSEDALHFINEAISIDPSVSNFHNNIALIYQQLGMLNETYNAFIKAIEAAPDNSMYCFNLANLYLNTGNNEEAIKYYSRAIELNNNYVDAYNNLGQAHYRIRNLEEAENAYSKAIELNSDYAFAYNNLGILYQDNGDFNAAMVSYKNALKASPNFVLALSNIAKLKKCTSAKDETINKLAHIFENIDITNEEEIIISFALGKLFDDCGEYEKAFHNFERGNMLSALNSEFNKETHQTFIGNIKRSFNSNYFNTIKHRGSESSQPIFVLGMPRSGTSLVEQIIASHSMVTGSGELDFFNQLTGLTESGPDYINTLPIYWQNAGKEIFEKTAEDYLILLSQNDQGESQRIVDKMPYNYLHLGLITILFPNAYIINCERNPYDTCLSIFFQYFEGMHDYSYRLEDLGYYYKQYKSLMSHWKSNIKNPMMTVKYEDLIDNCEFSSKKIIEFLDLTWEENCLNFYKTKRFVHTRSNVQVRQPIYTTSVNRWKNYQEYLDPLRKEIESLK